MNAKNWTGARTGEAYRLSLQDSREVWLNGEKVDVTTHPAFQGIIGTLSTLYDLQFSDAYREDLTYFCPEIGKRVGMSFLLPKNAADLEKKRKNSTILTYETWGQLPRMPDFMSNVLVGLYDFRHELKKENELFFQNVVAYYEYCRNNDLVLTHAIGDPQINRTSNITEDQDLALRIIKKTTKGVIVRGAKQLATLAPVSNEVLVYMSPSFALREKAEYVLWFGIPIATKGLKILSRTPKSIPNEHYSSPFSERFDEQDAMLFFDDVLVPWERVFLLDNPTLAYEGFFRINFWSLFSGAVRFHQRLLTFLGLSSLLAKAIGIHELRPILDKLGELTSYAEMIRLALDGMQAGASMTSGELYAPSDPTAIGVFIAQISMRLIEILREIAASGLIMHPSEKDLASLELKPFIDLYMRGDNIEASQKARLLLLAQDLVSDYYGLRQELYERWHRGDIVRNRIGLYKSYDLDQITQRIERIIKDPINNQTCFVGV